jgi:hypothetical protein
VQEPKTVNEGGVSKATSASERRGTQGLGGGSIQWEDSKTKCGSHDSSNYPPRRIFTRLGRARKL